MKQEGLNMQRILRSILAVFFALSGLFALAAAASNLYDVTDVKIEGVSVSGGNVVTGLELGDTATVDVVIQGTGNSTTCPNGNLGDCDTDVKVKVWVGGYEHGDVESVSDTFRIEPGVTYKKSLSLNLPADMNVDKDNSFTLYVEVYDSRDSKQSSYQVFLERPRHSLNIVDVVYDSSVTAGQTLDVEVRVENLGEQKEEDVKVEAWLNDVSDATYIDELAAFEEDNEDEESSASAKLAIPVSGDISSGSYDLTVEVTYDNGYETIVDSFSVTVAGTAAKTEPEVTKEAAPAVSVSSTVLNGKEEEPTTFTLSFTNSGKTSQSFRVTVNGVSQWATASVNPASVVMSPGEIKDVAVTLTPLDNTAGQQSFSLSILDGEGVLVKDVGMTMAVSDDGDGLLSDTGSWLKVGFVILLVIIIIVGLIVAFRKFGDDDEPLEPKEGKTYY